MEGIEKPSLTLPSAVMEGIEKLTLTTPSAFPELSTKTKTQYTIFEALEIIANCTDNIEKYLPIKTDGIEKPAFPLPELSLFPELSPEPELSPTTLLRKRRHFSREIDPSPTPVKLPLLKFEFPELSPTTLLKKRRIERITRHGMDPVKVNLFKKFNNVILTTAVDSTEGKHPTHVFFIQG